MEQVKLSLFADDMVLYIENIENSTKKLSEYMHGDSDGSHDCCSS